MNYLLHILTMIALYTILGLSLNLIVGYAGLLSICQGAFYGVGAYVWALLAMKAGLGFLPALVIVIALGGLLSLLVGLPSLRLRGDFFVLVTVGFQVIIFTVLYNWVGLTRGPYGIPGIPRPSILGLEASSPFAMFLVAAFVAGLVYALCWQLARSPYGRALQAIRDDELAATALGKNALFFKASAFVISGALAAIAGALYAGYITYIDPTSFNLDEAIFILAVVIIGGAGNLKGPVVGAVFMVLLPEVLRFLYIPDTVAPNLRQIIYGLTLILMMRYRPQGIAGRYALD